MPDELKPLFESPRLVFARPRTEDFSAIERWQSDPDIMRFQGGPWDPPRMASFLEFVEWHWNRFGFGHYVARSKESGEAVGMSSLKYLSREADPATDVPDLGGLIDKRFWRNGYATEGSLAVVTHGFEKLGFKEIGALNDPANPASAKALGNLGFRRVGLIEVIYNGRNFGLSEQWKLTREEFRSRAR